MLRSLPSGPLIVGYADWSECDPKISRAVRSGVNVLIWFAISLVADPTTGRPAITGGPNLTCVAETAAALAAEGYATTHLISVGGWDAPHPDTSFSAAEWWTTWSDWNAAAAAPGFNGFDGIDWDLEGNDDAASPYNTFSISCLKLVSELSKSLKKAGYLVSLAPPQSYLDVGTSSFSLSVTNPATCWHPEFTYAGRNTYAALLALAGEETFDFVSLQMYESWSVADCNISGLLQPPDEYLPRLAAAMDAGWTVSFSDVPSLGLADQTVRVPLQKLVLGLANGWAELAPPARKALLLMPAAVSKAYAAMGKSSVRGFMFWDIMDEGKDVDGVPLNLAEGLNGFLKVRPTASAHRSPSQLQQALHVANSSPAALQPASA